MTCLLALPYESVEPAVVAMERFLLFTPCSIVDRPPPTLSVSHGDSKQPPNYGTSTRLVSWLAATNSYSVQQYCCLILLRIMASTERRFGGGTLPGDLSLSGLPDL